MCPSRSVIRRGPTFSMWTLGAMLLGSNATPLATAAPRHSSIRKIYRSIYYFESKFPFFFFLRLYVIYSVIIFAESASSVPPGEESAGTVQQPAVRGCARIDAARGRMRDARWSVRLRDHVPGQRLVPRCLGHRCFCPTSQQQNLCLS